MLDIEHDRGRLVRCQSPGPATPYQALFFFTLVTGPRSLSLKLSDTRVYQAGKGVPTPCRERGHCSVPPGLGQRKFPFSPVPRETPFLKSRELHKLVLLNPPKNRCQPEQDMKPARIHHEETN